MAPPNINQTGLEFLVEDLIGEEPPVAEAPQDPMQEVADINEADAPIWASEEPVEDIIAAGQVDPGMAPVIEKEILRAEAVLLLTNLADKQSEETLADITTKVLEGYKIDLASRKDWEELNKQIIDLAKLLVKKKTYNGEVVANVKHPLIINACIQFAARAYPEIVKGNNVVKSKVIGKDPEGTKLDRANRVSEFMSFQLLNDMEDWEEGVDQMLFTLPAIGCVFKKSYFDSIERRNISETVFADDLVVNYFAESLERAPRVTHKIYLYHNEIVERITAGVFADFDIDELGQATSDKTSDVDDETPHIFLEQHRWYDLDEDGYQEPYIVTVHAETQKLVRIAPRFASDGIMRKEGSENGAIIKIVPEQYFTRYLFMPSIDGGFYGMGFGSLLMSTNAAINTLINQLLDAGTQSNRQAGFLGRGLKLGRGKSIQVKSGQWLPVDATGDDLRKNVFPMPVREPSGVLFQLLGMLIEGGKELAGMTAILAGNSPGANVPAESVLALIEQGLQVYSAIHKRIHRAQYKEFSKIRRLNALYLDQMTYSTVLDEQAVVQADFFNKDFDIVPVSDPNNTTMMQRMLKAKAMLELRGQGLDDMEITRRYLVAMDIDDVESLIPQEQQQDPAEQAQMQKLQAELAELNEQIEKLKSETALNYAKRDSEYHDQGKTVAGIENEETKLGLEAASTLNQIEQGRSAQSVGKAPGGVSDYTAKREYGLESNNQIEARAAGGPVTGGQPYLVGEEGPEIIVPEQSGEVIPNHEIAPQENEYSAAAEPVLAKHLTRMGLDTPEARQNFNNFFSTMGQAENSGKTQGGAATTSAKGLYQIVDGTMEPALNRLARTTGWQPWMEEARKDKNANNLTRAQQTLLISAQMFESQGTDALMKRIAAGDQDAMTEYYYDFHHTAPDEATTKNWERAMKTTGLDT